MQQLSLKNAKRFHWLVSLGEGPKNYPPAPSTSPAPASAPLYHNLKHIAISIQVRVFQVNDYALKSKP